MILQLLVQAEFAIPNLFCQHEKPYVDYPLHKRSLIFNAFAAHADESSLASE
jgi:hypothetical protein